MESSPVEDKKAATVKLATRIREQLEETARRMYAQQIPLRWVALYICQEAIEQVLCGARQVLVELKYDEETLLNIPPEDLSPLWTQHLQANSDASSRGAPHVLELQYATIKDVAGAAHAAIKQKSRNTFFAINGAPPGLAAFPMLASEQKAKTLPIPFILSGNPRTTQQKEYQKYMSHVLARRRLPGPRTYSACELESDVLRPELYT